MGDISFDRAADAKKDLPAVTSDGEATTVVIPPDVDKANFRL